MKDKILAGILTVVVMGVLSFLIWLIFYTDGRSLLYFILAVSSFLCGISIGELGSNLYEALSRRRKK